MLILLRCGFGLLFGVLWLTIWKRIPESWFCDYGQTSCKGYQEQRLSRWLVMIVMVILFAFSLLLATFELTNNWFSFFLKISFVWVLLQIAVSDFYFQIIPDQWIFAIIIMACLQLIQNNTIGTMIFALFQAFLFSFFLWLFASVLSYFFKQTVLGFGDIKLFFSLGFYFGLSGLLWILVWSILFCGMGCALLLLFKVYQKESICPFAPYIVSAAYLFLLRS